MITKAVYYISSIILNRVFCLFPLREKQVLMLSDVRENISGNFRFVYDRISSSYDIKLSLKADRRIRRTLKDWVKQCYYLATSKYILLDDYSVATAYIHVRNSQELVQLWHSSGAYKKFAHSRGGENGDIRRIHAGYKRYTKTITSSEYVRPCFAEAFSIPIENVYATGIPRTDIFFDERYAAACREKFYTKYPACKEKKVILFAPTYRGTKVEDADYGFDQLNFDQFVNELKDDYVILIKWHPALFNNLKFGKVKGYDLSQYQGIVYDISESREINDYLFITDVLITDYSSLIFDYALMDKPLVYFTYDLEQYIYGRGLYFPFEEYVYGLTARNTRELIDAVKCEELCEEKRKNFVEKFISSNDGRATEKAVKCIFG